MSFSVIIPSKSAANLVPCIKAIRQAGETCRIIVVDDGVHWSQDWELGGLGKYEVWFGVKPFVFARNINIGIRVAGNDDVILLNDDALLKTPNGFTWLGTHQHRAPQYGITSAACNTTGNPNQYPRASQCRAGIAIRDEPRTVCFICVYIPRTTINAVGLLDEQFIGYGMEDDDYCLRVRNAGLKLGIFDDCFVDHGSLTSSFRGGPTTGGDFRPNMRLFIDKWGTDNWGRARSTSEFAHLWPAEEMK